MIEVTVEIVSDVIEVTAELPLVGVIWAGIDEGNSTTTYTDGITDE